MSSLPDASSQLVFEFEANAVAGSVGNLVERKSNVFQISFEKRIYLSGTTLSQTDENATFIEHVLLNARKLRW